VASDLTLRRGCRQTFGMQKSMLNSWIIGKDWRRKKIEWLRHFLHFQR
jgi:hypothetical protein